MSATASAPIPHPLALAISLIAAGSGVAALFTYFSLYAALPLRLERVERVNEVQEIALKEMQQDAMQRREVLAAAMATLQQIDLRTKRIEDRILSK
jgi:ABC-type Na+ efflux pump permease subunit